MKLSHDDQRGSGAAGTSPRGGRDERGGVRPRLSGFRRALGRIGWLFGGGGDWAGARSIRRGYALIGDLARNTRQGPAPAERVFVSEDRSLDLEATAFSLGISVPDLRARLDARRRETARIAYIMFVLGLLCLLAWFRSAISAPLIALRLMLAVDFLPFCVLFFLMAFYQALLNYQVRSGRRVGWREYLMADDGILPR